MARILLIEDDTWIADCYRTWLTAAGHAVDVVHDAQAALDHMDTARPNAIMLDLLLPHANGIQVLHTLQSYSDWSGIPVLLCSSSLPENLPDVTAYGVIRVIPKAELNPRRLQTEFKELLAHAAI